MKIFVSASAQRDNLGDLVLRRQMVRWLADHRSSTHVHVGSMPPGFVAGLELEGYVVGSDLRAWLRALLHSAGRGEACLVFAPGQQALMLRRLEFVHALTNVVLAAAIRLRGGQVIKVGRALEGPSRIMLALERILCRLSTGVWFRDGRSAAMIGARAGVVPDLAVGSQTPRADGGARDLLAMSWRFDHPVPHRLIEELLVIAGELGLEPVLVTQVESDGSQHEALARMYRIRHLSWEGRDHQKQLAAVEETLERAVAMVSNRLHALIFAWNLGALPVGYSAVGDIKIRSHLGELGLASFLLTDESTSRAQILLVREAEVTARAAVLAHDEALARIAAVRGVFDASIGRPERSRN